MDKSIKLFAMAIVALAIVCIAALAVMFLWKYFFITSTGGRSSSLDFRYYADNQSYLNNTQYTQNGTFNGHMKVGGSSDTILILLQDYNVTAFHYNGSMNKTHMIVKNVYFNESNFVTPIATANYNDTFAISGIPDGFHDVEFVAFVDPYNYTGKNWRYDGPFTSGGVRFNVIVNNSTKVMPQFTDISDSNETLYSQTYPFGGPSLTKDPFSAKVWPRENVAGGSIVDYYVSLRNGTLNGNATGFDFMIVQLLDYQQIPIRAGSHDTVYYGHVNNNTSAAVHLSFKAPDTPGQYKLVDIIITDPYQDLEVPPYVMKGQTWTNNRDIMAWTTVEHQDIIVS